MKYKVFHSSTTDETLLTKGRYLLTTAEKLLARANVHCVHISDLTKVSRNVTTDSVKNEDRRFRLSFEILLYFPKWNYCFKQISVENRFCYRSVHYSNTRLVTSTVNFCTEGLRSTYVKEYFHTMYINIL